MGRVGRQRGLENVEMTGTQHAVCPERHNGELGDWEGSGTPENETSGSGKRGASACRERPIWKKVNQWPFWLKTRCSRALFVWHCD